MSPRLLDLRILLSMNNEVLVASLRIRAQIRRTIPTRKSVQDGSRDRISDLLEQAADEIERLNLLIKGEDGCHI